MQLTQLHNEDEYRAACAGVEARWKARPGTVEFEELQAIAALVDQYEDACYPAEPPSSSEVIRARMDDLGLQPHDLERCLGGRETVARILNRDAGLTDRMITGLSELLRIPRDMLVDRDESLNASARREGVSSSANAR